MVYTALLTATKRAQKRAAADMLLTITIGLTVVRLTLWIIVTAARTVWLAVTVVLFTIVWLVRTIVRLSTRAQRRRL